MVVCYLVGDSSGILTGVATGGSKQKVFLGIGGWHLGRAPAIGVGSERVHVRKESSAFPSGSAYVVPCKWGQRVRRGHSTSSATELRMRLGD